MTRLRIVAMLATLLAGSAASTLALAIPPNGSVYTPTPTLDGAAQAETPAPSPTAPPPPTATATIPPLVTSTPVPEIVTLTPAPEPTVRVPAAPVTPTPLSWPLTPDDLDGSGPALASVDPALVPADAWFSQEALDDLRIQIETLLAERSGRYSVVVVSDAGYTLFEQEASERHEAASLYKLAILVEVYRQRQSGRLAFDDVLRIEPEHLSESAGEILQLGDEVQIDTLLFQMIAWSSNVAAWALLDLVGIGNVNRSMAGLGLRSTFIELRPLRGVTELENGHYSDRPHLTSAGDLARLFELMLAGRVVSPEASAEMLALLAQQRITNRLPAYLPADAVVAHKTGNLSGIVHDAGVIFTPSGPLVVVVLTEHASEYEAGDVMGRLGALVYQFGQEHGDAP